MTLKPPKLAAVKKHPSYDSLADYQTPIDNLSALRDYLENQSRRNNLLIDGVPDSKYESWSKTEIKAKKVLFVYL